MILFLSNERRVTRVVSMSPTLLAAGIAGMAITMTGNPQFAGPAMFLLWAGLALITCVGWRTTRRLWMVAMFWGSISAWLSYMFGESAARAVNGPPVLDLLGVLCFGLLAKVCAEIAIWNWRSTHPRGPAASGSSPSEPDAPAPVPAPRVPPRPALGARAIPPRGEPITT